MSYRYPHKPIVPRPPPMEFFVGRPSLAEYSNRICEEIKKERLKEALEDGLKRARLKAKESEVVVHWWYVPTVFMVLLVGFLAYVWVGAIL